MLILFDIDGTLLRTNGAGRQAMEDAGRELFGPQFTYGDTPTAGQLDPLIWTQLARRNSVDDTPDNHDRFRRAFGELLRGRLSPASKPKIDLMPGMRELIAELERMPEMTIGLLTGNYPETGRIKIEAAGLEFDTFRVGAWGCDATSRRGLPPVAIRLHRDVRGYDIETDRVIIIGDTVHDVDCAKHNRCRSLAVATGGDTWETLSQSLPDLLLRDLADTEGVMMWITKFAPMYSE